MPIQSNFIFTKMEPLFRNELALIPSELLKELLSAFKIKQAFSAEDIQSLINLSLKFGVEDIVDALSETTLKSLSKKLSIEWSDDALDKLHESLMNEP